MPTSTTESPVTHTADVDVNRAVIGSVHVPLLEDKGSINNNVPNEITAKKPKHMVLAGFTSMSINYNINSIAIASYSVLC